MHKCIFICHLISVHNLNFIGLRFTFNNTTQNHPSQFVSTIYIHGFVFFLSFYKYTIYTTFTKCRFKYTGFLLFFSFVLLVFFAACFTPVLFIKSNELRSEFISAYKFRYKIFFLPQSLIEIYFESTYDCLVLISNRFLQKKTCTNRF